MTVVPVKVLVVEPIWKRVLASTGRGWSTLVTPKPAACSVPSAMTPIATPGILSAAMRVTTSWSSSAKRASRLSPAFGAAGLAIAEALRSSLPTGSATALNAASEVSRRSRREKRHFGRQFKRAPFLHRRESLDTRQTSSVSLLTHGRPGLTVHYGNATANQINPNTAILAWLAA